MDVLSFSAYGVICFFMTVKKKGLITNSSLIEAEIQVMLYINEVYQSKEPHNSNTYYMKPVFKSVLAKLSNADVFNLINTFFSVLD